MGNSAAAYLLGVVTLSRSPIASAKRPRFCFLFRLVGVVSIGNSEGPIFRLRDGEATHGESGGLDAGESSLLLNEVDTAQVLRGLVDLVGRSFV